MKNFRSTLIFSVIVVGLCIFTFFELQKGEEEETQKVKEGQIYADLDEKIIRHVKLQKSDETIELKKDNGKWQTLTPFKDKGDASAINSYIREFAEQEVQALVFEGGQIDIAQYGLNNPKWTIEFKDKNEKTYKVKVGSERAFDDGLYLQKEGDGNVYLAPTHFNALIEKDIKEFRSKELFPAVRLIREIRFINREDGYKSMELVQNQGQWTLKSDPSILLDQDKIKSFTTAIRNIKADSIMSDDKSSDERKKYRLNKPVILVDMKYSPEGVDREDKITKTWKLRVGEEKENTVYAFSNNTKSIYKLAKYKAAGLYKTLKDVRNLEFPFAFDVTQVDRIKIERKGRATATQLNKENDKWINSKGDEKVIRSNVDELISSLHGFRVVGFEKSRKVDFSGNKIVFSNTANKDIFSFQWGGTKVIDKEEHYYVRTSLAKELITLKKEQVDKLFEKELLVAKKEKVNSDKNK